MFVYVFLILYILTCVIVNFYFCIRKFVLNKKLKLNLNLRGPSGGVVERGALSVK